MASGLILAFSTIFHNFQSDEVERWMFLVLSVGRHHSTQCVCAVECVKSHSTLKTLCSQISEHSCRVQNHMAKNDMGYLSLKGILKSLSLCFSLSSSPSLTYTLTHTCTHTHKAHTYFLSIHSLCQLASVSQHFVCTWGWLWEYNYIIRWQLKIFER